MQDPFTGQATCLQGSTFPGETARLALLGGHWKRLRAFDLMVEAAGQCGIVADQDRDFAVLPEDDVSLLELAGGSWAEFGSALRRFRELLPFVHLDPFGFKPDGEDLFETNTAEVVKIGAGVEALAFESRDGSIYKFFYFREGGAVGSAFRFSGGEDNVLIATAVPATYSLLLAKLLIVHEIGMPTEVLGITPEGVLVVKQARGESLPQGADTSKVLPPELIPIPSRFLRADRDHPRLLFLDGTPWLVADMHARNFARGADGALHVIDLVAAPWPMNHPAHNGLLRDWLERVRADPGASVLMSSPDHEL